VLCQSNCNAFSKPGCTSKHNGNPARQIKTASLSHSCLLSELSSDEVIAGPCFYWLAATHADKRFISRVGYVHAKVYRLLLATP
jgi:hypothetical protein